MHKMGCLTKDNLPKPVILSQCTYRRTPGWLLLPLRGNSPPENPFLHRISHSLAETLYKEVRIGTLINYDRNTDTIFMKAI